MRVRVAETYIVFHLSYLDVSTHSFKFGNYKETLFMCRFYVPVSVMI